MRIDEAEAKRRLSSSRNIANLVDSQASSSPSSSPSPSSPSSIPATKIEPIYDSSTPYISPVSQSVSHETIRHNGKQGTRHVPEFLRDTMGLLVERGNSAASVASAFGVSADVAERARTGRVGGMPANEARRAKIQERRLDIEDQALLKLMTSLNLIAEEDLAKCSPKELSNIAVNLGKVAQLQKDIQQNGGNTNIVVYAPELRDEKKFKVIEVG